MREDSRTDRIHRGHSPRDVASITATVTVALSSRAATAAMDYQPASLIGYYTAAISQPFNNLEDGNSPSGPSFGSIISRRLTTRGISYRVSEPLTLHMARSRLRWREQVPGTEP